MVKKNFQEVSEAYEVLSDDMKIILSDFVMPCDILH